MKDQKNPLEWTVFALSGALILATVAYLVRDALLANDAPPSFRVDVSTSARRDDVLVHVRIHNDGTTSAERVRVEVRAEPDATREVEVDFVPRTSERDAYVTLPTGASSVRAHVVGWVAP